MPWVRIDDHFDEHPKLQAVGPLAWGVWLAGLAYCNRNLTDGFIPRAKAHTLANFEVVDGNDVIWTLGRSSGLADEDADGKWVASLLVEAGLWDQVSGGYIVHDYDEYQRTKAVIEEERDKKRAAGQAGGKARAKALAKADAKQVLEQVPSTNSSKIQAQTQTQESQDHYDSETESSEPPLKAEPGRTLSETLAAWCASNDLRLPPRSTQAQAAYRTLLEHIGAVLPSGHPKRTWVLTQVIVDSLHDGAGVDLAETQVSHLMRLVKTKGALPVFDAAHQAVMWGAGLDPRYADDPMSFTKYIAGVFKETVNA